ncbi:MAG: deoxyribodipyrimidine photo-lyase [Planctomycetota bacterium]
MPTDASPNRRPLVWFRSDLRVEDHAALHAACEDPPKAGVVAAYAITPGQWKEHHWGDPKIDFIRRALVELQKQLAGLNIPLKLVHADTFDDVPAALLALAQDTACTELHFGREHEHNERKRDQATEDAFENAGLAVHTHNTKTLFEPGDILTQQDGWYTVFTPFSKKCRATWQHRHQRRPAPSEQRDPGFHGDAVPNTMPGFAPPSDHIQQLWPAGPTAARSRLDRFLDDAIADYDTARDTMSIDGTSRLSADLALGTLSPAQVADAVYENTNHTETGPFGYITEILWREFYQHLLLAAPHVSRDRSYRKEYDELEWNTDDDAFQAWCEGKTGVPIVDAAMRQLSRDAWMHNRCRMVTAMFLTKNLFQDWRRGERYFASKLIDIELASNNGGWQWSASTGTDAAPYFRVMNPQSQGEKHDPAGDYIREYVDELKDAKGKAVHAPHAAKPGLFTGGYPEPIVDLKQSRAEAIDRFKAFRS